MKKVISALFVFILASSAWAASAAQNPKTAVPKTTLNTASHYLDSVLMNTLASLKMIASTPEAKNGDWKGIKRYLKQLEAVTPGVYFYVLPDGNYYSVALDYTNLNLSNRGYFHSLFAGNPIMGFPIYSRSSGKKSALMAAPIVTNGKVTGALGASVFLDELQEKLNREIALPGEYTWFVLNSKGMMMLDNDSDFIFMNALTQGSKSLRDAVTQALKNESGPVQYELDSPRHGNYLKLPNMEWWMFLAKIEGTKAATPPKLKLSLDRFVPGLQKRLNQIDGSLATLIEKSKVDVKKQSEIRKLLNTLLDENPDIVEASFVDTKGIMRMVEPREYKNFENSDISSQEHVKAMMKKPAPLLSDGFTAVENFTAVVVSRPLYNSKNAFAGFVNLLIRPELLVDSLLKKTAIPEDYELWIMQPDGMIIYDQDKSEIGRMLFTDPIYADYKNLLKLSRKIVSAPAGKGSYLYLAPESDEKAIKEAIWQSVKLNNKEWRVVLAYRPYENK
ncbi:cache domain-containing protein [Sulfurimonas sp. HSL3-7]|uniref:cache domain-containing protein n=1 Tax=Sulfonitrofixus jiaomeiensis TaxID=3131938 RepID=UPI0031F9DE49